MLRIPRRAGGSAKVEPEARVLAMLKNRLPFAVPDWRVANAELVAIPCSKTRLRWSSSLVRPRPPGSCRRTPGGLRGELGDRARRLACRPHFRRRGCGDAIRTPTQARRKVADDVDRVRREFVVNDKRLHRWQRWPRRRFVVARFLRGGAWRSLRGPCAHRQHGARQRDDRLERGARVDDPAIDMAAHLMVFGEEGLAKRLPHV